MDSKAATTLYPKQARPDYPERRCEARFKTAQKAMVIALDGTVQPLAGSILDVSNQGMKLKLNQSLAVGAPVRIDIEADLILGEIRYCFLDTDSSYGVGVEMDQVLSNAKEVARRWTMGPWVTAA